MGHPDRLSQRIPRQHTRTPSRHVSQPGKAKGEVQPVRGSQRGMQSVQPVRGSQKGMQSVQPVPRIQRACIQCRKSAISVSVRSCRKSDRVIDCSLLPWTSHRTPKRCRSTPEAHSVLRAPLAGVPRAQAPGLQVFE